MTKIELKRLYFDWMYQLVNDTRFHPGKIPFYELLYRLYEEEFTFLLPMDGNRAADGVNLRYRFGREKGIPDSWIMDYIDDRPCSILEMMIALSIKCEEQITCSLDDGDEPGKWFWVMIESLGLDSMNDVHFRAAKVDSVIDIFLNREYQSNGRGGLFRTHRTDVDMRDLEIWYQLCWYINNDNT